ncbi:vestitone reductase-like [Cucumis melo var. makuwa]|uniref:Vestitone reductase-like n=1 Tax=Cucumis melo var. makuwa TaxID=1194695 RepID=A0A5A7TFG8_CUCMM|nr:vestitone reductase-like [Cucumis melo var. makuwa]TYK24502.1 vestitone reductase-like [Cucumis melo var. makuwa]
MEGGMKGKVCVTGGTGFIGSWLVKRLLEDGYSVSTTVRSDPEKKRDYSFLTNLPGASKNLQIYNADLNDPDSFGDAIEGCIGVFHVATPVDFEDKEDAEVVIRRTVDGALGILKACLNSRTVRRVVYTSSASAIQFCNDSNKMEYLDESNWAEIDYINKVLPKGRSYPISKKLTEQAILEFSKQHGLEVVSVIPTFVVGPFICPKLPGSVRTTLALVLGIFFLLSYLILIIKFSKYLAGTRIEAPILREKMIR